MSKILIRRSLFGHLSPLIGIGISNLPNYGEDQSTSLIRFGRLATPMFWWLVLAASQILTHYPAPIHCQPASYVRSQKQLIGSINWILNAIFSHLVLSWSVVKKDSAKLHAISSLTNLCDKKYNFHLCPWPHTDIKSIQYVHTYLLYSKNKFFSLTLNSS